jgi:malate synthase
MNCVNNAGRWDYMFSIIKSFRTRGLEFLLPDRNSVTMTAPFMRAYTQLLVKTCHKRGAHAIGGMAAFIPSKDPVANEIAYAKVLEDKTREAGDGFDGSWVAHPGMVDVCRQAFDAVLKDSPNQLSKPLSDLRIDAAQLLDVASANGQVTEAGLRNNISVGIRYLESWLRGYGAVGINNLMEDAATAEISRSQVWQWIDTGIELVGGEVVSAELVRQMIEEEMAQISQLMSRDAFDSGRWMDAREMFENIATSSDYPEFLTLPAYAKMP